jgi:hypothetical protein
LPASYYVGNGHVVDSKWNTSAQFDIIIADYNFGPVLFRGEDGTEYFPYESVYAVGEVKSTYYKSKSYISDFITALTDLRLKLSRPKTPPNYLGRGITLDSGLRLNVNVPYRNPMVAFMIFVASNDFDTSLVTPLYLTEPPSTLPSVICLLDKGLIVNALFEEDKIDIPKSLNVNPEFNTSNAEGVNYWIFQTINRKEFRLGAHFAFLYFSLWQHLQSSALGSPHILSYLGEMFTDIDIEWLDFVNCSV